MDFDVTSLDFIYYPVAAVLWFWHRVFGFILGADNGWAWLLSVFFLVVTLRLLFIGAIVKQRRTLLKMRELNPQLQEIRKRYANDRVKMTEKMEELQKEHGFNPLLGCLPALVQIPVFIGLFHVIRSFNRTGTGPTSPGLDFVENANTPNYVFGIHEVQSFLSARVFGVPLSASMTTANDKLLAFSEFGGVPSRAEIVAVCGVFTLMAAALTHWNARFIIATKPSVVNPQERMMNNLSLWVFPLGILVSGAFFPLAILGYWLCNNAFTNVQSRYLAKYINAPDGRWDDYDADRIQGLSSLSPLARSYEHIRTADKHDRNKNYRLKYFHLMAAGHLAASKLGSSSTLALTSYVRAADCARYRSQGKRYQKAMAYVEPFLEDTRGIGHSDPERRALILRYKWVRVFATRELSTKGAGARLASEQIPLIMGMFMVKTPIAPSDVARQSGEYWMIGMVAAASICNPRLTLVNQKKTIALAAQTAAALIACGSRSQGEELLRFAATTQTESSRAGTLGNLVKAEAIDYLHTQIHDAALDSLEPIVIDAINSVGHGIGAGIDAVQSLV